jgi:hypothetical protein
LFTHYYQDHLKTFRPNLWVMTRLTLFTFLAFCCLPSSLAEQLEFNPKNWKQLDFVSHSNITRKGDRVEIESNNSASAYYYEFPKPIKNPFLLSWEWQVNGQFPLADPSRKENDDYVARVYIVFQQGFFKWQVNSVNYVWVSETPPEPFWFSPYDDRSAIVPRENKVMDSSWVSEQVNPFADFSRLFEEPGRKVVGIAIMSDTDDTARSVMSAFRRISIAELE